MIDALKAMNRGGAVCCEGQWRGVGGGCDVEGEVVVSTRCAGGKGSHAQAQGLGATVEEMRARPKIPASRPRADTIVKKMAEDAGECGGSSESGPDAIDSLQLK